MVRNDEVDSDSKCAAQKGVGRFLLLMMSRQLNRRTAGIHRQV